MTQNIDQSQGFLNNVKMKLLVSQNTVTSWDDELSCKGIHSAIRKFYDRFF